MEKGSRKYIDIFARYLIIILIALPNLFIFYKIFTPLTTLPVFFLINIFFNATLSGTTILLQHISIEIIPACVAGSAYYLLFILNLSVPQIKLSKRIKMVLFAFVTLLLVNIIRIFLLSLMAISGSSYFDITHKIFWYLLSIVFVVGIWFTEVKIFKIKQIPVYSDLKSLIKQI